MMKSKHIGKPDGVDITIPIPELVPGKTGIEDLMNKVNDVIVVTNALIEKKTIKPTPKTEPKKEKKEEPKDQ